MRFFKNKTRVQKKIIIPPDESHIPKLRISQLKLNEYDEVMPQKVSIHEGASPGTRRSSVLREKLQKQRKLLFVFSFVTFSFLILGVGLLVDSTEALHKNESFRQTNAEGVFAIIFIALGAICLVSNIYWYIFYFRKTWKLVASHEQVLSIFRDRASTVRNNSQKKPQSLVLNKRQSVADKRISKAVEELLVDEVNRNQFVKDDFDDELQ